MTVVRALLALPVSAALLVGCGADPVAERRDAVAALTEAANDGDADAVRSRAEALLELVERQLAAEQLDADEADRLRPLAQSVRSSADVVDEELQARLKAEADAEAARQELEQTQRRLEEERRKAEEAARQAEEREKDDEDKGKKDDEDEDEKDDDD